MDNRSTHDDNIKKTGLENRKALIWPLKLKEPSQSWIGSLVRAQGLQGKRESRKKEDFVSLVHFIPNRNLNPRCIPGKISPLLWQSENDTYSIAGFSLAASIQVWKTLLKSNC